MSTVARSDMPVASVMLEKGTKTGVKRSRKVDDASAEKGKNKSRRCRPKVVAIEKSPAPCTPGIKAIVINLDRRPDRLAECAARMQCHCPWVSFSRFSATDGRKTTIPDEEVTRSWHTGRNVVYQKLRAQRKGWDDLDTYQVRELDLSPGERGCASSHIRAWQHCLDHCGSSEQPLLVLEDDAAPVANFTEILTRALAVLPKDAGLLYLGYSQAAEWRREISPELVESEYVWTTVAYIVWPAAARKLLSRLPIDQPVDNWMATLCAEGEVKAYCVRPKIVRQAEAWNVNSDVAHSDEHYWGPDSDIHHSDAFYWGKPPTESEVARPVVQSIFDNIDGSDSEDEMA